MSLLFEVAAPLAPADAGRADVACFIGYVARRPGRQLPATLRAQLAAAGWVDGPWARPESQIENLHNLPVVLDSWHLFDWLFAWDARPLSADSETSSGGTCATYLGAAMRSFFARGGRRAVVIRVGDPWPYVEGGSRRAALRRERLRRLLPDFAEREAPARPFEPHNPATWQGIQHVYGLREPSMLLLPDLPDACTYEPLPPPVDRKPPPAAEGFVECSAAEPQLRRDDALRRLSAPRLDSRGFAAWQLALASARDFLANPRYRREALLVAALPLPDASARRTRESGGPVHAQADLLAYLKRAGVLRDDRRLAATAGTSSAFAQLAWPWLRTHASSDLPEGLEPADGVLAGLVAAGAVQQGCFRSVAGGFSVPRLRDVADATPVPSWGLGPGSPTWQLARQVCVFAPVPEGWALQSDVTSSAHEAWRFGGASRLVSTLLRAARAVGDTVTFDANGPALWARLRSVMEDLLLGFWHEGAFAGASSADAFSVHCDRSTMTQADLDAGRLVVEISVRPAASIERINVVLQLGNAARADVLREVA